MSDFKDRHFEGEIVLRAVRWYCRYGVSYRDLEQMMGERDVPVDHIPDGQGDGVTQSAKSAEFASKRRTHRWLRGEQRDHWPAGIDHCRQHATQPAT